MTAAEKIRWHDRIFRNKSLHIWVKHCNLSNHYPLTTEK